MGEEDVGACAKHIVVDGKGVTLILFHHKLCVVYMLTYSHHCASSCSPPRDKNTPYSCAASI